MTSNSRRVNALWAVGLLLLGVLTRVPFRSQVLFHWDSVNFALGMEHYDVRAHQPHPPGYILYVMLGRLVDWWVGDANASLVWISIGASGLAAMALFLLGKAIWGRRIGIVAAMLLLTSPLFWFHGEVALSYMVEAVFVALTAFLCYRHLLGIDRRAWLSGIALALAGGFRQNTMVFLLPLWIVSIWRLGWRRQALGVGVLALLCIAWLVPMVAWSGGVRSYLATVADTGEGIAQESSLLSWREMAKDGGRMCMFLFYGLGVGLIPLVMGVWHWGIRNLNQWRTWARNPRVQLMFWWIAPSLAFYLIIHIRQAGHTFTFIPALLLALSLVLVRGFGAVTRPVWRWGNGVAALVVLSNTAFFFLAPPFLLGLKTQMLNTPSWTAIHTRDIVVGEKLAYIRANFAPQDTAVLATQFDLRLPDYYLRDYRLPSLSYQTPGDSRQVTLGDDVKVLVLFNQEIVVDNTSVGIVQEARLRSGETLRWLERSESQVFVIVEGVVGTRDKEPSDP